MIKLVLSYAMLCYVMLCYVMLCYVMLCYVMLLCSVLFCSVLFCSVIGKLRISVRTSFATYTALRSPHYCLELADQCFVLCIDNFHCLICSLQEVLSLFHRLLFPLVRGFDKKEPQSSRCHLSIERLLMEAM